jgi:hypothetical protein
MTVIPFPQSTPSEHHQLIARARPCDACGHDMAMLRRFPRNHGVAWCCSKCQPIVRSRRGFLFIPHRELRASGIEPDRLPEAIR